MTITDHEQTSTELLKKIAIKHQPSLEAFYKLYETTVYRFALSRLNEPSDASDTLNEVMMEVWKYADRFEGRSKVSTWLLGITHHKVYDRLRKRKKSNLDEDIDDYSNTLEDDAQVNMEHVLSGLDDANMIQLCMDKLSDNHREVIHLSFFEDLHYGEIASIAKCPENTVKTRVFHAKQALKSCLAKLALTLEPAS